MKIIYDSTQNCLITLFIILIIWLVKTTTQKFKYERTMNAIPSPLGIK